MASLLKLNKDEHFNPLYEPDALKPVLNTLQLWGMAVGLVISEIYFGWSFGWATAGTLGFTITALFIATMYTTFIFSFTELTTAIPQAGGPFAYSKRAFGPIGGYLAGAATLIEFVFAPPAIALAMAAEEAKDPKRSIPTAYIAGILTLVALAMGVMFFAGGSGDWTQLANINDPLPQAMKMIVGESSGWLHMLVWLGLFGLVASFHGIIMGYSRQIFALSREAYLPAYFAKVHPRFKTPHRAILAGGVIGIAAIFSDEWIQIGGLTLTANIVTMAVFGAILMYIISMLSLFKLRRTELAMIRPFLAPFYPYFPAFALVAAFVCLLTMIYFNPLIFGIFVLFIVLGYVYFCMTVHNRANRTMIPFDET
jgi:ethanolamine permease